MLSQGDTKKDYYGNVINLFEGLEVVGYQEDEDIAANRDDIIVEGICVPNATQHSQHVKWLIKINEKGIRYMSDILEQGW